LLKLCQKLEIVSSTFEKFPYLPDANTNAGVFVGPDIRKLMFDEDFLLTMNQIEREPWIAFKSVVTKFLRNNKHPYYVNYFCKYAREIQSLG
jgi:hypothetical protein